MAESALLSTLSVRLKALLTQSASPLHFETAPARLVAVKVGLVSLARMVAPNVHLLDPVLKKLIDAMTYRFSDACGPSDPEHEEAEKKGAVSVVSAPWAFHRMAERL
jgi:hypothetical protein